MITEVVAITFVTFGILHLPPVDFVTAYAAQAAASGTLISAAEADLPWIDAHSHIWPPETDKFPLAPGQTKADLKPPSFTDDELMAIARPEGVGRVVLIQHSIYHLFDNSYLIDAVRRHPKLFRIQGMVDDHAPHAGEAMKNLLPKGVTGFRITPFIRKPEERSRWLETPGMVEMWKTGASTGQAMCLLIDAADLPSTDRMCERHPDTPVVIDHFARIGMMGAIDDQQIKALCQLAKHPHVHVKISAYYALGAKKPPHTELIPMIQQLMDSFTPARLMWGSDSPYQIVAPNSYSDSVKLITERCDFLTASERDQILRRTAEKVFFS